MYKGEMKVLISERRLDYVKGERQGRSSKVTARDQAHDYTLPRE
jgi:hypothetical protein